MNRAERRRQKLNKREPTYNLTASEIKRMKQEAIDAAMILLFSLPVKVLKENYGWGSVKRLPEFGEALTDEYQKFADGELTLKQLQNLVFEETGIKFQKGE